MSKLTKAQLIELEELLVLARTYLKDRGAPNSITTNLTDALKSVNWIKESKQKNV